jgi:hypothetical protein
VLATHARIRSRGTIRPSKWWRVQLSMSGALRCIVHVGVRAELPEGAGRAVSRRTTHQDQRPDSELLRSDASCLLTRGPQSKGHIELTCEQLSDEPRLWRERDPDFGLRVLMRERRRGADK